MTQLFDSQGRPVQVALQHTDAISEGYLPGHRSFRITGFNPDVGSVLEDIAEQGGTINLPAVATAMQIDGAHADDTGVITYTSTATGGSLNTLEDTAQDFTAGNVVAVGDMILLDDDVEFGMISAVTATILTVDGVFSRGMPAVVGENYRIVDKSAGGAGAQIVEAEGLDGNYEEQAEFVATNGTGLRSLTKSYLRVNFFHVMLLGTNDFPTGTILLEDQATGAVTYAQITALHNNMLQTLYTVPAGHRGFIKDFLASAAGTQPSHVILCSTSDRDDRALTPGVFQIEDIISLEDSTAVITYALPLEVPAKADIKASAEGAATGPSISASFGMWIEDE